MQNNLIEVRVVQKAIEAVDICSLELASVSGEPLPPFSAGAHIDLHFGGFVRQYSLCNNPSERHRYQVAVLRDPQSRGGSVAIHDGLSSAQTLKISAPRNHFSLRQDVPHSLLLAAGVGITPILCMAERLANSGVAFTMHYCTRSRARTAFRRRIEQSAFADAVSFYFDEDGQEQKFDLVAALEATPPGTHLYTCGPAGFLSHVLQTAGITVGRRSGCTTSIFQQRHRHCRKALLKFALPALASAMWWQQGKAWWKRSHAKASTCPCRAGRVFAAPA